MLISLYAEKQRRFTDYQIKIYIQDLKSDIDQIKNLIIDFFKKYNQLSIEGGKFYECYPRYFKEYFKKLQSDYPENILIEPQKDICFVLKQKNLTFYYQIKDFRDKISNRYPVKEYEFSLLNLDENIQDLVNFYNNRQ